MICNSDAALYKFRMPIIKALIESGDEVVTIGGDTGYKDKLSEIVNKHYDVSMYGKEKFSGVIISLWEIIKIVKHENPDVIHGFTHYGNLMAGIAHYFSNKSKFFISITGMGRLFIDEKFKITRFIGQKLLLNSYRLLGKKVNKIFVQNADDCQLLSGYIDLNKIIIQPGSGVEIKSRRLKPVKELGSDICVYMISRPVESKGYKDFIMAAGLFRKIKKDSNLKFFYAGGDSLNNPWDSDLERLCNENDVKYLGYIENVHELYDKADVVILPSFYREGTPRSLLEALSFDCKIITTNMPGCKDTVIDGWNGFKFTAKDINEIISSFFKLNTSFLNSSQGRSMNLCLAKFDSKFIVNETLNCYKRND